MKYLSTEHKLRILFSGIIMIFLIIILFNIETIFGLLSIIIFIPMYFLAILIAIIKKRIHLRTEFEEEKIRDNYRENYENKKNTY